MGGRTRCRFYTKYCHPLSCKLLLNAVPVVNYFFHIQSVSFLTTGTGVRGEPVGSRVDALGAVGFYNKVLPPPELISSLCAIAPVVKTVWSVSIESGELVLRMRTENHEG